MIHIYLCDDNKPLREHYQNKLSLLAKKHDFQVSFSAFSSGEQLLFHLSENPNQADIIYLDILMGTLNGIETAKQLREIHCNAEIIFLTSSEAFVFQAFDTSPMNYIIKGAAEENEKLETTFVKAIHLALEKDSDVFLCRNANQRKKIPLQKISHFEIRGRIVTVYFNDETFDFYSSINTIEETLKGKNFIRCHRSYLVNFSYINSVNKTNLLLTNGMKVPLGSTYVKDVKVALSSIISNIF